MSNTEVDTFVRKFNQLWNAGLDAHLDLDCHAGIASVSLRLQLGHAAPGPLHQETHIPQNPQRYFSQSYQRRRERRSAKRAHMNESNAEEASNGKEIDNIDEGKSDKNDNKENNEIEAVEATATEGSDNIVHEESTAEDAAEPEENNCIENVEEVHEIDGQDNDKENIIEEPCSTAVCVEKTSSQEPSNIIQDVIPVYCTAMVENCPDSHLNEEYRASIRRFLASEEHLVQNILSTEIEHISSRSFRNMLHTHTVSVILHVRTARLWESPASYVRKHLGLSNYWERSNGTIVRLSRIHQK